MEQELSLKIQMNMTSNEEDVWKKEVVGIDF